MIPIPLNHHVTIRPTKKEEETTIAGLVLQGKGEDTLIEGEVVGVGSGQWQDGRQIPLELHLGDKVVFKKYAGTHIRHGGEDWYIVSEMNVEAVLPTE